MWEMDEVGLILVLLMFGLFVVMVIVFIVVKLVLN